MVLLSVHLALIIINYPCMFSCLKTLSLEVLLYNMVISFRLKKFYQMCVTQY